MKAKVKQDNRFNTVFVGGRGFNQAEWTVVPSSIEEEVRLCDALDTIEDNLVAKVIEQVVLADEDGEELELVADLIGESEDVIEDVEAEELVEMSDVDELALRQHARALGIRSWASKSVIRLKADIAAKEGK